MKLKIRFLSVLFLLGIIVLFPKEKGYCCVETTRTFVEDSDRIIRRYYNYPEDSFKTLLKSWIGKESMIFPDIRGMKKYYLRKPNKFYFSDGSSYRNLYLTFENDSIMRVSNSSLPFSRRSFVEYYKYYMNSPSQIIVAELIQSTKSNKVFPEFVNCIKADTTTGYVLPFRDRDFYSQAEIFPNISGDTIFCFSYDLSTIKKSEYLQVGCFVFKNRYDIEEELTKEEKHSEITLESEQKPVVLPQYLDSAIRSFDYDNIKSERD